jgi:hypothetical protein
MHLGRLAALAGAALLSAACHAQPVHHAFSGSVYQASSPNNKFDLGIALGTGFTGEFWFDASTQPYGGGMTQSGGTEYGYHSGGLTIVVGGLKVVSAAPVQIIVDDNVNAGYDSMSVLTVTSTPVGDDNVATIAFIGLNDPTGMAFSSAALPTTISSLLNANSIGLVIGDVSRGEYDVFGTVAELHAVAAVPEPETYGLMMAGLGVVAFAVRQRHGPHSGASVV